MTALDFAIIGFRGDFAAGPTRLTGATPPAWLPIVVGVVFLAAPYLAWVLNKRPEAQVSGITAICTTLFGAGWIIYGVHLWLG